jgi:cytochrome c-type biogenesis protein CcmH
VLRFLEARYGDFVLMNPPKRGANWLLWGTPFAVLGLGALIILFSMRARAEGATPPLSAEERAALERIVSEKP